MQDENKHHGSKLAAVFHNVGGKQSAKVQRIGMWVEKLEQSTQLTFSRLEQSKQDSDGRAKFTNLYIA